MKSCLFLLGMLISIQLQAQQKFIEVTISDTIQAKPDFFIYRLSALPAIGEFINTGNNSSGKNKATPDKKPVNSFDTTILRLKKMGYHFVPLSIKDNYDAQPSILGKTSGAAVLLHSPDSLLLLSQYIKKQDVLLGSVETAMAENEEPYYDKLYKKLVDEATVKAKKIAAYSGLRVAGVISITEANSEKSVRGGWTSYPPLSALGGEDSVPGWRTTIYPTAGTIDTYPIGMSLLIRFLVE